MSETGSAPAYQDGHLRVIFFLSVPEERQADFLTAYERIRYRVAGVDGHLGDQLCQSLDDPSEWVLTSEWESPEHFLRWERGAEHRQIAGPLVACTTERRSLRFLVRRETRGASAPEPELLS